VLLTISTTHRPATDLGYLLHKHPARVQAFTLPFGQAHVFYPEASEQRCTAALLVDIDPVGLVRRGGRAGGFALAEYVNDRPYVASSFMSVAMITVFKSAMAGTCNGHEELAAAAIPLQARVPVLATQGGEDEVRRVFEPLGYAVETRPIELDPEYPEWGASRYLDLRLSATCRLADLLTHLYVLMPVLDADKHYWVDDAEIEKLMHRGEGWLASHPERELIVRRYLKQQASLFFPALEQLDEAAPGAEDSADETEQAPVPLRESRLAAVETVLEQSGARSVLDLGCGAGALLIRLMAGRYERIVGLDVSARALQQAARRLKLDELHDAQRQRIELMQGALTYRDRRLAGFDAAVLMEVIEHLDPMRLPALEHNVFETARPATVVVTTPNAEYNARWESLPAGEFRHADHRFEWNRTQFAEWGDRVAQKYDYSVRYLPVGDEDPTVGSPTQMAVFTR
jgi:3' terminal RNA ribose 2'-O-methyltransferase Hen1